MGVEACQWAACGIGEAASSAGASCTVVEAGDNVRVVFGHSGAVAGDAAHAKGYLESAAWVVGGQQRRIGEGGGGQLEAIGVLCGADCKGLNEMVGLSASIQPCFGLFLYCSLTLLCGANRDRSHRTSLRCSIARIRNLCPNLKRDSR